MADSTAGPGPLAGLRVVDASRVLAGPFCGMLLGDLGADVVKVERPGSGDETRHWGPPFVTGNGSVREATYYLAVNRNKRSLTLNLTTEAGRRILHRLAAGADIFLHNFRPGSEAALGSDYETLARLNPRLIYCAISGFGHLGPDRLRPGYDLLMQGFTGLMSITGEAGRPPVRVGVAMVDLATGAFALSGVLAALHAREATGRGQRVDLSLLSSGMAWMTYAAQHYFATGEPPRPSGSGHPSLVPYQAFQGADAKWFVVAVGTDEQWRRLCGVLEPAWADDPRFATNPDRVTHRDELIPDLARRFAARPASDWVNRLDRAGVPVAPVHSMAEVFAHPQVRAMGLYAEVPHAVFGPLPTVGSAFSFSETPPSLRLPPPMLGQHTVEILAELGYSGTEVETLRSDGVI